MGRLIAKAVAACGLVRSPAVWRRSKVRVGRGLLAAALTATSGAIAWSSLAGAGTTTEPATLAHKGRLTIDSGAKLDAPGLTRLEAGRFIPRNGRAPDLPGAVGGGDEVIAALTGSLVPVAVESPDGSLVAYSAWRELASPKTGELGQGFAEGQPIGIPSIRVYDVVTGVDRLVEVGAHSPALSLHDRLAFVKGDEAPFRINRPYNGNVLVGSAMNGRFVQWTDDSARYFTYAWAGDTLLVYKGLPESEATDLYAFTGPQASHLIAPNAFVVALSPDAKRVLVTVGRRMVEVVRVADGAIEASMALDGASIAPPDSPTTPHYLMYGGSWRGDRVVANSDLGLVVLNLADGVRIESILTTPGLAHGIVEPTFADDTHVVGWADLAATKQVVNERAEPTWDHALVSCGLSIPSCTVGESQPSRTWTRWVGNPSR